MDNSLDRFRLAQDDAHSGFAAAIAELRAGRKRGHWIWYVFPQICGLGFSSQSQFYGLDGIDEAVRYLADSVLGPRLAEAAGVVAEQVGKGVALEALMGSSIDTLKLVSSLTLFEAAAARMSERDGTAAADALAAIAGEILAAAQAESHPRCQTTLALLKA